VLDGVSTNCGNVDCVPVDSCCELDKSLNGEDCVLSCDCRLFACNWGCEIHNSEMGCGNWGCETHNSEMGCGNWGCETHNSSVHGGNWGCEIDNSEMGNWGCEIDNSEMGNCGTDGS